MKKTLEEAVSDVDAKHGTGRRTVISGGHEYEVVFDGSHHGRDADLLRRELAVEDKLYPAVRQRDPNGRTLETVIAVLRAHAPLTMRQIMEIAELPMGTVNSDLWKLRQMDRLAWAQASQLTEWGRTQRAYSLKD